MSNKFIVEGGLSIPSTKVLTMGSINISETEIGFLDGITAGTAAVSKAIVADSSGNVNANALTFTDLGAVTTVDINGGTIDGATIATSNVTVGAGKTLDVSAGTLTLAADQISGDKVEGGTIDATTITALTFGSLNDGTINVAGWVDEDDMSSDSATHIPTQQSVKKYVDDQLTGSDLDFTVDGAGDFQIDLDSEEIDFISGSGITVSGSGNAVTFTIADDAIDSQHYAAESIDNEHLADDAVGADELAADAVVNASVAAGAAIDLDKLDWTSASGTAIEDFAQDDYIMVYDNSESAVVEMTMDSLEDSIFGNVSGDITIAAGGAATIGANSVALATDTTGNYVADVTAGTGLTSTGATTGENISHSLSVDAVQAQITDIGTSSVDTAFAGEVTIDETLTVTGVATLGDGALLATSAAPISDRAIANKKYVDDSLTSSNLSFTSDGDESGLQIDLESESLDVAGGSNLTTSAADNTITVALDSAVSGLASMSATTVTDGTASLNGGSLSSLVNVTGSGDLTMGTITNTEFSVDANGNTDIDGTLNVEGVPTFQAQSVHSSGIDCDGDIDLGGNAITGTATNMLLQAGDDASADLSGEGDGCLALQSETSSVVAVLTNMEIRENLTIGDDSGDTVSFNSLVASDVEPSSDSTYDLGQSDARWAEVHHDAAVLEYAKKASFTKTMTGGADVAFTFDTADYKAVKIVCRVADGSDFTAKEVLIASDTDSGNLVEYGTVSTSTERDATFTVTYAAGICSVKCTGTADDVLNGTYELIA
jgi:hypothetical protein